MTQITSNAATNPAPTNTLVGNSIEDLDLDVFLDLMLAELQNQDPLDPMDNDQLLSQISQIREISASDKLSETLDAVLLGQNVTTAAGLIGTEVEGLTDDGRTVRGAVRQVTINDGAPLLEVAIESSAEAGDQDGAVDEGSYVYEVAWETEDGVFSVRVPADTADFGDDFAGSIRLENLPETSVNKRVYRTNRTGEGDLKLIGELPGFATAFTDQLSDGERGTTTIPDTRSVLRFANGAEVRLSNVRRVEQAR